jgi:hypothetical protein
VPAAAAAAAVCNTTAECCGLGKTVTDIDRLCQQTNEGELEVPQSNLLLSASHCSRTSHLMPCTACNPFTAADLFAVFKLVVHAVCVILMCF